MLTLTRKIGEQIIVEHMGEVLTIEVSAIKGKKAVISMGADRTFKILRGEAYITQEETQSDDESRGNK